MDWLSDEHVIQAGQSALPEGGPWSVGAGRGEAERRELPGGESEGKRGSRALALPDPESERPVGTSTWQGLAE